MHANESPVEPATAPSLPLGAREIAHDDPTGAPPQRVLCTAMRRAHSEPVTGRCHVSLGRRLRLGAVLTGLMLASYVATICGLTVFFSGVYLTTEYVFSGEALRPAPERHAAAAAWDHAGPSQDQLARDFSRYRQQVAQRQRW